MGLGQMFFNDPYRLNLSEGHQNKKAPFRGFLNSL
jgi:hypothetical protein